MVGLFGYPSLPTSARRYYLAAVWQLHPSTLRTVITLEQRFREDYFLTEHSKCSSLRWSGYPQTADGCAGQPARGRRRRLRWRADAADIERDLGEHDPGIEEDEASLRLPHWN